MGRFVKVAAVTDIELGKAKVVEVEGKTIALFNIGGTFYALDDTCPHQGGPLSEGDLDGLEVTCPWHAANFDLQTGEVVCGPAKEGVAAYPARVVGADVEIEI